MRESHGSCSSAEMVLGIEEVSVVRIVERGMEKRVSSSAMSFVATAGIVRIVVRRMCVGHSSYQRLFQHLDSSYRRDRSCLRRWCRWCEAS